MLYECVDLCESQRWSTNSFIYSVYLFVYLLPYPLVFTFIYLFIYLFVNNYNLSIFLLTNNPSLLLLRSLDVYLSTILDCLESEEAPKENYEVYSNENTPKNKKAVEKEEVLPLSVVSAAIGEITAKDIMIAASSNGKNKSSLFILICGSNLFL